MDAWGSKSRSMAATRRSVLSATSWPTISPVSVIPNSSEPPALLSMPQSVSPARVSWPVERLNSTLSDSPWATTGSMSASFMLRSSMNELQHVPHDAPQLGCGWCWGGAGGITVHSRI